VLRAFAKSPATCDAVLHELSAARGHDRRFDAAFERYAAALSVRPLEEQHARRLTQSFATLMQASVLIAAAACGPPAAARVAEGFCATRLDRESGWGAVFGSGESAIDTASILDRAWTE
jgi:putative acyl-CoA dehydrogenase